MKKKRLYLFVSIVLLFSAFVLFNFVIPVKKAPKINFFIPKTKEQSREDIQLKEEVTGSKKTKLEEYNRYSFKDISLEYRANKLVIVFFKNSLKEAQKQVSDFFQNQNLDPNEYNFEYIDLNKSDKEPPSGFGQS
ncbi:hypothetical protein C4578_00220 [Candidatus Microgenomates bacterium]|nr:MAG: hypothetical protein C4578_00220 [Candidatus Microgenomates bacterium]